MRPNFKSRRKVIKKLVIRHFVVGIHVWPVWGGHLSHNLKNVAKTSDVESSHIAQTWSLTTNWDKTNFFFISMDRHLPYINLLLSTTTWTLIICLRLGGLLPEECVLFVYWGGLGWMDIGITTSKPHSIFIYFGGARENTQKQIFCKKKLPEWKNGTCLQ